MILSDREVLDCIKVGKLVIEPKPEMTTRIWKKVALEGHLSEQDGEFLRITREQKSVSLKNWDEEKAEWFEKYTEPLSLLQEPEGGDKFHLLQPKELILVYTKERFSIPHDSKIMALVQGKSGLARLGLSVHVTAPIIHPGFGEKSTQPVMLEIYNHSHMDLKLYKGMPICQYIFEQVHGNYLNVEVTGFGANQPKKAA